MIKGLMFDFLKAYFLSNRAHSMIRRISWISLVSLSLSVSSMIIILSIMKSLNQRVQSRLLNTEAHVVISYDRNHLNPFEIKNSLEEALNREGVERTILSVKQDIILRNWNGRFHGATGLGLVASDLEWYLKKIQNENASQEFFLAEGGEITLGGDLAEILGVYPGDHVHLILPTYLIEAGVELPKLQKIKIGATVRSTISEIDMGYIFYDFDTVKGSLLDLNSQKYFQHLIWLWDPAKAPEIKEKLTLAGYLNVATWEERNASIFFALKLEKLMIGVFLTLAVLVATFSLLMSLALFASQKKKDFILLRLLGFSPANLNRLLVRLSLGLGGLGIMTGVIFGVLVSGYLELNPVQILPDIYHDSDISAQLDIAVTMGIIVGGFCVLVGASVGLAKLLPSKNIGEALKHN